MLERPLVAAARRLAEVLPQHRAAHDANRQLEPAVVGALREGNFGNALVPTVLGGAELEPADYVETIEALAAGDAATGWVAMTASTSAMLAAYLPRATATLMWASAAPLLAGVFAPTGELDADGRLTGSWSYASGCKHADWFALGALFERRHVVCFVPRATVRITDNWDTLGLAGTGSHDIAVDAVRVGADHVTSVFDRRPWCDSALYRVPVFGLLAAGVSACALGIASAALGHAGARLANDKEPGSALLASYAGLRAELDASRAYLLATCAHATSRSDAHLRGELRLAAVHVTRRCTDVVRGAFHLAGGAGIRSGHPLQRALRDIETAATHRMVADRVLPAAVRALLGIGNPPPDL